MEYVYSILGRDDCQQFSDAIGAYVGLFSESVLKFINLLGFVILPVLPVPSGMDGMCRHTWATVGSEESRFLKRFSLKT